MTQGRFTDTSPATPDSAAAGRAGPVDRRKQELARTLSARIANGYRVESQTDAETILVKDGRRRFGLFGGEQRERVTVNDRGAATVEKLTS